MTNQNFPGATRFPKLTVNDVHVRGQNVLVRVDYNVPLRTAQPVLSESERLAVSNQPEGPRPGRPALEVESDLRIRASLPTIELLRKKGARRIILISHLGRPEGKKVPELSLKPVADRLKELLPDVKVNFVADVSGPDVEEAVEKTPVSGVLLLENLRFYPGEEANSAEFAREIAETTHADLFVQDGFAVVHRAHASTDAITKEVPSVAGLLLEKEISTLGALLDNPKHPFWLIIGGAKVDDKQPLIDALKTKVDEIFVGGKIAADGYGADSVHVARDFKTDAEGHRLDIADSATDELAGFIKNEAKTVLWNGTLGKVEDPEFAESSTKIARVLSEKTASDPSFTSVICGGDTTGFVENLQATDPSLKFSLISTGGGAALEFLSGEPLPGLEALDDR